MKLISLRMKFWIIYLYENDSFIDEAIFWLERESPLLMKYMNCLVFVPQLDWYPKFSSRRHGSSVYACCTRPGGMIILFHWVHTWTPPHVVLALLHWIGNSIVLFLEAWVIYIYCHRSRCYNAGIANLNMWLLVSYIFKLISIINSHFTIDVELLDNTLVGLVLRGVVELRKKRIVKTCTLQWILVKVGNNGMMVRSKE